MSRRSQQAEEDEAIKERERRSRIVPNLGSIVREPVMVSPGASAAATTAGSSGGISAVRPGAVSMVAPPPLMGAGGSNSRHPSRRMSQEEQDRLTKERERAARSSATSVVPNLADQMSGEELQPTVISPSGRVVKPSAVASIPPGARSVMSTMAAPNLDGGPSSNGSVTRNDRKMSQAEQDRLLKERERAARSSATSVVPNLADQMSGEMKPSIVSPSGRVVVPSAAAVASSAAARSAIPPPSLASSSSIGSTTSGMSQLEKDRLAKDRERAARSFATSVVPNLADQMSGEMKPSIVSPSGRVVAPSAAVASSAVARSAIPPPSLASNSSIGSTTSGMSQLEKDRLAKDRERAARSFATSVVPNLADQMSGEMKPSIVSPSGRVVAPSAAVASSAVARSAIPPPSLASNSSIGSTTSGMSQLEKDRLAKDRERAARSFATSVVPNLADQMSGEMKPSIVSPSGRVVVPSAAAVTSSAVARSAIPPPSLASNSSIGSTTSGMSQLEKDRLAKDRERVARGSYGSTVVPNLAAQLDVPGPPVVAGAVSVGGTAAVAGPPLSQAEQDRLKKEQERAARNPLAATAGPAVAVGAVAVGPVATASSGLQYDRDLEQKERERKAGNYHQATTGGDSSQARQARYNVVAELLGEEVDTYDDDQMSYAPTLGGDSVNTYYAGAGGRMMQQQQQPQQAVHRESATNFVVESEDRVRARYQAAAMAMGGQLTQEDEDRMMKERERQAAESSNRSAARLQEIEDTNAKASATRGGAAGAVHVGTSDLLVGSVDLATVGDATYLSADALAKARGRRTHGALSVSGRSNDDMSTTSERSTPAPPRLVSPGALSVSEGQAEHLGKGSLTHVVGATTTPQVQVQAMRSVAPTPIADTYTANVADTMDTLESQTVGDYVPDGNGNAAERVKAVAEAAPDEKKQDDAESPSRRKWYIIGGVILVLIIAIGVGVALASGGGGDDEGGTGSPASGGGGAPVSAPTIAPVAAPAPESERRIAFREYVIEQGISTEEQLTDPLSPQYKALTWLTDVDTNTDLGDDQVVTSRYVLAVFYYSLNGENWTEDSPWLDPSSNVCDWNRITCEGGGVKVISEEEDVNILGTIPTEVNALPYLEELNVNKNKIRGLAGPLDSLKRLSLKAASLGEIYREIPTMIFEMTNLQALFLAENNIVSTISTSIGRLSSLTDLDLSGNGFTGSITTQFDNMVNLSEFSVANNNLSGDLMETIRGLTSARRLDGTANKFTGTVGPEIVEYTNLQRFEFSGNQLGGPFPNVLFNVSSLGVLDLEMNFFTGTLSADIAQPTGLQQLSLGQNGIRGSLPSEIGRLSRLIIFKLHSSLLEGPIPTEIGLLLRLSELSLETNFLTGRIPTETGNLQNLSSLNLATNLLTGPIPSELGNLSNLNTLNLESNNLTGTLPSEVCNAPSLVQPVVLGAPSYCGECPKCL